MDLDPLRAEIDRLDRELLTRLRQRAELVAQISRLKKAQGLPQRQPDREAQIVEQLLQQELGALSPDAVRAVYQAILAACRPSS